MEQWSLDSTCELFFLVGDIQALTARYKGLLLLRWCQGHNLCFCGTSATGCPGYSDDVLPVTQHQLGSLHTEEQLFARSLKKEGRWAQLPPSTCLSKGDWASSSYLSLPEWSSHKPLVVLLNWLREFCDFKIWNWTWLTHPDAGFYRLNIKFWQLWIPPQWRSSDKQVDRERDGRFRNVPRKT